MKRYKKYAAMLVLASFVLGGALLAGCGTEAGDGTGGTTIPDAGQELPGSGSDPGTGMDGAGDSDSNAPGAPDTSGDLPSQNEDPESDSADNDSGGDVDAPDEEPGAGS